MGVDHLPHGEERNKYVHPSMNIALVTPLFVLAGALGLLFLARVSRRIRHSQRRRESLRREDQTEYSQSSYFITKFKRNVLYAPLLSTRHSREFRICDKIHMGNVPLRLEAILLSSYLALNLIFFFVLVDWWEDYEEKIFQLQYAAASLAVMNTPLLVLTAGRNNPLIFLLGVAFNTFNLFHRWVGRFIIVAAVVHMGCVIASKAYEMSMSEVTSLFGSVPIFIYGLVAVIAFLTILFQSISPLRHAFYEAFLHFHILLAIMAFVGLWYHLRDFTHQYVILATVIIWGLERAGRLGSLIWRNWGKQRTTAMVELLPGNVARVTVSLARSWTFRPGQYMYLYIPSLGLWTSHPFSVAWTSSAQAQVTGKRNSNDSINVFLGAPHQTTMSFLIKKRDGFTNKLLRKVKDAGEGHFRATALAEGPFGGLHSLASYGTVVLIAGGIGITHPMSYLHEFVNGFTAKTIAVRRVNLVWVIRSLEHMSWIQPWMASLLSHSAVQAPTETKQDSYFQQYLPGLSLSIQIYVTDNRDCTTEEYMSDESPWTITAPASVTVSVNSGKPCFDQVLESESAEQIGAMAVSVCGPGGMGDDVRKSVREMKGTRCIDLYEEAFSW